MAIPILPDAPSRTDPVNFSTKADAWVSALGPWTTAANQLELSLQQSATTATSTTSVSIGLGDKGFGIPTGKSFIIGSYVYIVASADISKVMYGQITSYSGGWTLSVNVSYTQGSGTFSNWNIGLSVPRNGNENFNSLRVGNLYPSTTPYTWSANVGTVHLGGSNSAIQNTLFSHTSTGSGWACNAYLDLTGTWRYQYAPWGAGLMTAAQDEFQWYGAAYNTNPSNPAVSWQQTFGVSITHGPYRLNDASTANGLVRKSQMDSVASSQQSRIQPITASVSSNNLTITLNPTILDFRSSNLGSGIPLSRAISSTSITLTSGATLGLTSGVVGRIAVLALDNNGTVELAVCNVAGGFPLDEVYLISTSAPPSFQSTVYYSNTARSGLAYRVVGFVDVAHTSGNWINTPTLVQGAGGQSLVSTNTFGKQQSWQDMTASRAFGTTYYNTSSRDRFLMVTGATNAVGLGASMSMDLNGVTVAQSGTVAVTSANTGPTFPLIFMVIPPGSNYRFTNTGYCAIYKWLEFF